MEKCSICFQEAMGTLETDILMPPDGCVKIFNYCLGSLHSSIAGNFKKHSPFEDGDEFPFCKMCLDSAVQLNQVVEQLSAFQKQLSDLNVEFCLSVLYRRSQTNILNKKNGAKSNEHMIEINVSGLPQQLFSLNKSKNASEEENSMIEDAAPTIITGDPKEIDNVYRDYNENENDFGDTHAALHECPGDIENDDLFILPVPIQNTVEEEDIKLEVINRSCNATDSSNLLLTCPAETDSAANCFISNKIGLESKESNASVDLSVVKYECDPLNVNITQGQSELSEPIDKAKENRNDSSKPSDFEITEPQILMPVRNPSIILKRMQFNQMDNAIGQRGEQLKTKHKQSHSDRPKKNSSGRNKTSNDFKQRRGLKIGSTQKRGPFLFQCELCNKSFKYKVTMDKHKRSHTAKLPFQKNVVKRGSSKLKADECSKIITGEPMSKVTVSKNTENALTTTTTTTKVEKERNGLAETQVHTEVTKPIEEPNKPWNEMTPKEIAAKAKRISAKLRKELKHRCKICNISLPTAQKRYLHRLVHERDFVEYLCPYCTVSRSYCSQNTAKMHMRRNHNQKLKQGLKLIRVMKQ